MKLNHADMLKSECRIYDVTAYSMREGGITEYDYEKEGRQKHLLFYQTENERCYTCGVRHIATLAPKDIIFLPHGAKYLSRPADAKKFPSGMGISFRLATPDGEPIFFDEGAIITKRDFDGSIRQHFKKILSCIVNPVENTLRITGELSVLLDEMFSEKEIGQKDYPKEFKTAVRTIENEPWRDLTLNELAIISCMSESTFLRNFKEYSGGVSPIRYRNNVRLMMAEELAASKMTLDEIAERLGFYDSAHLCNLYRKYKGKCLKK